MKLIDCLTSITLHWELGSVTPSASFVPQYQEAPKCHLKGYQVRVSCSICVLQIFKWELRKGWDVLLAAFLGQFTSADNVALYMKTSPYHSDSNFGDHMKKWATEHLEASGNVSMNNLPTVYVIDENMPQERLRRLYAAADCFVLPSRSVM